MVDYQKARRGPDNSAFDDKGEDGNLARETLTCASLDRNSR